jgi:hypothetical protein
VPAHLVTPSTPAAKRKSGDRPSGSRPTGPAEVPCYLFPGKFNECAGCTAGVFRFCQETRFRLNPPYDDGAGSTEWFARGQPNIRSPGELANDRTDEQTMG